MKTFVVVLSVLACASATIVPSSHLLPPVNEIHNNQPFHSSSLDFQPVDSAPAKQRILLDGESVPISDESRAIATAPVAVAPPPFVPSQPAPVAAPTFVPQPQPIVQVAPPTFVPQPAPVSAPQPSPVARLRSEIISVTTDPEQFDQVRALARNNAPVQGPQYLPPQHTAPAHSVPEHAPVYSAPAPQSQYLPPQHAAPAPSPVYSAPALASSPFYSAPAPSPVYSAPVQAPQAQYLPPQPIVHEHSVPAPVYSAPEPQSQYLPPQHAAPSFSAQLSETISAPAPVYSAPVQAPQAQYLPPQPIVQEHGVPAPVYSAPQSAPVYSAPEPQPQYLPPQQAAPVYSAPAPVYGVPEPAPVQAPQPQYLPPQQAAPVHSVPVPSYGVPEPVSFFSAPTPAPQPKYLSPIQPAPVYSAPNPVYGPPAVSHAPVQTSSHIIKIIQPISAPASHQTQPPRILKIIQESAPVHASAPVSTSSHSHYKIIKVINNGPSYEHHGHSSSYSNNGHSHGVISAPVPAPVKIIKLIKDNGPSHGSDHSYAGSSHGSDHSFGGPTQTIKIIKFIKSDPQQQGWE